MAFAGGESLTSFVFTSKHDLLAFGRNREGQLGLGHRDKVRNPTRVEWGGYRPVSGAFTEESSILLDDSGQVWGTGSMFNSQTFSVVSDFPRSRSISACGSYLLALSSDGEVWSVIRYQNQLRREMIIDSSFGVINIAAGPGWCAVETPGAIRFFKWYSVEWDEDFIQNERERITPLKMFVHRPVGMEYPLLSLYIEEQDIVMVDRQGKTYLCRCNLQTGEVSCEIPEAPPLRHLIPGCDTFYGLDEDGQVWALSTSQRVFRRITTFMSGTEVAFLAVGRNHALFAMKDSSIMVMGDNHYGELGLNCSSPMSPTPTTLSGITLFSSEEA